MAEHTGITGGGGRDLLLYACSGRKNVAEIADRACRQLAREGFGRMNCLSGFAAGREEALAAARAADLNVVIDGCPNGCGGEIFDRSGARNYVRIKVTDLDVEESDEPVAIEEQVNVVVRKVKEKLA